MHAFRRQIRLAVILLLTVRVLALPLAWRPESPKMRSKCRLVVRMCSWPAARPQRSIAAKALLPHPGGKGFHHSPTWDHGLALRGLVPLPSILVAYDSFDISRESRPVPHPQPPPLRC